MFFKTLLIGTMPKASPIPAQSVDKKFHITHFTKIGAKVRIIASKKNAPILDLSNFTQPCTVRNASLKALPTTGIHPLITNLNALEPTLSTAPATILCIPSAPTNSVDINPKAHLHIFEKLLQTPERFSPSESAETMPIDKKIFKIGIKNFVII